MFVVGPVGGIFYGRGDFQGKDGLFELSEPGMSLGLRQVQLALAWQFIDKRGNERQGCRVGLARQ